MTERHEFQNQELHDKLRDLVINALGLLQEKHKSGSKLEYTTIVEGGLVVSEDGSLDVFPEGRKCRTRPDFAIFIFKHQDELEQLYEWKAATECLSKDRIITKQMKGELIPPFGGFAFNLLRGIINMSIDEKKPFLFSLERFESVYDEMEKYFYSDSVVRKWFCPLLGFSSEVEEICLGGGVKIRRISKDEILDLWNHSEWFKALVEGNTMAFSIHVPLKYLIELSVEAQKIRPGEKVEVRSANTVFDNVVSALRLFKEGWITYPFVFSKYVSRFPSGTTSYGKSGVLPSIPMQLSYELAKEEVKNFKAFYQEIEGKLDHTRIALTRFNETYRREGVSERKHEDVLIDCCIAFESLFCRQDTRQKGEIISIGASMLLGKDNREREEIRDYLRKAYQVRNDIVHASLPISDSLRNRKVDDDLGKFVHKIEQYLRLCIVKLI